MDADMVDNIIKKFPLGFYAAICFSLGFTPFTQLEDFSPSYERVEEALKANFAFKINLKNNVATYYENGIPKDKWAIASGDISGAFHGGESAPTPKGIFNVQRMVHCPKWNPGKIKNNQTGELLVSKEDRMAYFESNPELFGPCGKNNPLGNFVIWFQQPYGLHGNSNEAVMQRKNPEARRVSGGCVRNPNHKIAEVFKRILAISPSMANFLAKINEQALLDEKNTMAREAGHLNIKVIVGEWDSSVRLTQNSVEGVFSEGDGLAGETYCRVKKSSKIDSVYPLAGAQLDNLPSSVRKVRVLEAKNGLFKTHYGWLPKELLSSCDTVKPKKLAKLD